MMTRWEMRWIWVAWVIGIAVSFAVFEGIALATDTPTLSHLVWETSKVFPLLPFLFGGLVFGLGVHFFWIWKPDAEPPPKVRKPRKPRASRIDDPSNSVP